MNIVTVCVPSGKCCPQESQDHKVYFFDNEAHRDSFFNTNPNLLLVGVIAAIPDGDDVDYYAWTGNSWTKTAKPPSNPGSSGSGGILIDGGAV